MGFFVKNTSPLSPGVLQKPEGFHSWVPRKDGGFFADKVADWFISSSLVSFLGLTLLQ